MNSLYSVTILTQYIYRILWIYYIVITLKICTSPAPSSGHKTLLSHQSMEISKWFSLKQIFWVKTIFWMHKKSNVRVTFCALQTFVNESVITSQIYYSVLSDLGTCSHLENAKCVSGEVITIALHFVKINAPLPQRKFGKYWEGWDPLNFSVETRH